MNDKQYTDDELIHAISVYVDSMDTQTLMEIVSDDLYTYFRKSADVDEILEFIEEQKQ